MRYLPKPNRADVDTRRAVVTETEINIGAASDDNYAVSDLLGQLPSYRKLIKLPSRIPIPMVALHQPTTDIFRHRYCTQRTKVTSNTWTRNSFEDDRSIYPNETFRRTDVLRSNDEHPVSSRDSQ